MVSGDVKFIEDKCWSDPSDIQQEESSDLPGLPIRLPRLEVQQQEETPTDSPSQNEKTRSLRELYEHTPLLMRNFSMLYSPVNPHLLMKQ